MKNDLIISNIVKILLVFILMFGIYLQFNGDSLPGGGFQAGMVLANGLIIYNLANNSRPLITDFALDILMVLGVILYFLIGLIPIFKKGEFLNYYHLIENHGFDQFSQKLGIGLVEVGVAMTVFSVTLKIFYLFSREDYDN